MCVDVVCDKGKVASVILWHFYGVARGVSAGGSVKRVCAKKRAACWSAHSKRMVPAEVLLSLDRHCVLEIQQHAVSHLRSGPSHTCVCRVHGERLHCCPQAAASNASLLAVHTTPGYGSAAKWTTPLCLS